MSTGTLEKKNFLGIPIDGEVYKSHRANVKQRPVEEFGPILQAVISMPGFVAVKWRQYTPYFNDGDVCEFSVSEPSIRFAEFDEECGDYEDGFKTSYDLRSRETYDRETGKWVPKGGADPRYTPEVAELLSAIEGGPFENALYDAFGDHAQVTVFPDRIEVETYEHE